MRKKTSESTFLKLLENFINVYMPQAKGLSHNTVLSYKACFRLLIEFMEKEKNTGASDISFQMLNQQTVTDFLDWLENERKCSVLTRNQRLAALFSFSEYAQNRDFDAASCFRSAVLKVPVKRAKGKERAFFTFEEVKILLNLPETRTVTGRRDKVLLTVMYASGARAQEICDLRVRDLRYTNGHYILHILGKGRKARQVQIGTAPTEALRKYLKYKGIDTKPDRYVFSSQTHEQMTVSCVEAVFKKYVKKAKEQHPDLFREESYPPHSMRHTTAVSMLEAGVSLPVIKAFLGHSQIATTEIYASMRQETVNEKVKQWNESFWSRNEEPDDDIPESNMPAFLT